ncbi:hypothetical protein Msi02_08520 [Microbispora siamensis]|uniref:Uncharacterized protein n=1 Tax=Microbispora siamensis TaxID=564413 RepID=A0ABQ4GF26_9ACTN|nr:hypothetical protein Msi02_08520 [Microbispora siamensis]
MRRLGVRKPVRRPAGPDAGARGVAAAEENGHACENRKLRETRQGWETRHGWGNRGLWQIGHGWGNRGLWETGRDYGNRDLWGNGERREAGESVSAPAGGFPTGRRRAPRRAKDLRPTPRRWPEPSACGC